MDKLSPLSNIIGNFTCRINCEEINFIGFISKVKERYILNAKIDSSLFGRFDFYSSTIVWGVVSGKKVTLFNNYLQSGTYHDSENAVSVEFNPSEIIVGNCYCTEPVTKNITMMTTSLNWMLNSTPIRFSHEPANDGHTLLKSSTPIVLSAKDKYGELKISQAFSTSFSRNEYRFGIESYINYSFSKPMSMMDAVAKIASANNLFSFFANSYLPLKNFAFYDLDENSYIELYLNHDEPIPYHSEPFLISSDDFSSDFNDIWNKWIEFYEESYIPTLFYEMICNHSTRINRFLNLVQSLEIYSKKYRKKEVKKVAQIRNTEDGTKGVYLKHRLEDLFSYLSPFFNINDQERKKLSKTIADKRNLYTHYAESFSEPPYEIIFAGCHVLEFTLLAIVFLHLGIEENSIVKCKRFVEFQRIDSFVNMILNWD